MAKSDWRNDSQANQVLKENDDDRRCVVAGGLGKCTHRRKAEERPQRVSSAERNIL